MFYVTSMQVLVIIMNIFKVCTLKCLMHMLLCFVVMEVSATFRLMLAFPFVLFFSRCDICSREEPNVVRCATPPFLYGVAYIFSGVLLNGGPIFSTGFPNHPWSRDGEMIQFACRLVRLKKEASTWRDWIRGDGAFCINHMN